MKLNNNKLKNSVYTAKRKSQAMQTVCSFKRIRVFMFLLCLCFTEHTEDSVLLETFPLALTFVFCMETPADTEFYSDLSVKRKWSVT